MNDNGKPIIVSRRLLQKHLQKLHIQDGDILALKAGSPVAKEEVIQGIVDALGRLGHKGKCLVVVVNDFKDLSVLDETTMGKHGWYRLPHLQKLLVKKTDAEMKKEESDGETHRD